jgi:hypothetical protein
VNAVDALAGDRNAADHRTNKRHDTTVPRRGGVPTSVLECDLEHLCGVGDIGVIRPLGQQTLGLGSLLDLAACTVEAGMARRRAAAHIRDPTTIRRATTRAS